MVVREAKMLHFAHVGKLVEVPVLSSCTQTEG